MLLLNTDKEVIFQKEFALCPKHEIRKLAEYTLQIALLAQRKEYSKFLNILSLIA